MAALSEAQRNALESQRRAARAEGDAALALQAARLEERRETEVAALREALARREAAAAAEERRGQLLLENTTNQVW